MNIANQHSSTLIGNLACITAYAIFGFNILSCKEIAIDGNITPIALFCLRPVVVCIQPVIAVVIALALGLDHLTMLKVLATVLVFTGIGLVNIVPKTKSAGE